MMTMMSLLLILTIINPLSATAEGSWPDDTAPPGDQTVNRKRDAPDDNVVIKQDLNTKPPLTLYKRSPRERIYTLTANFDSPLAKRLILTAVATGNDVTVNRRLLDWLSSAKSRELFSSYGKRLSDILQHAKYSGHQAWFSGYGKRDGGDGSNSRHFDKVDIEGVQSNRPTLRIKVIDVPSEPKPSANVKRARDLRGANHQAWFSGYGKRPDSGFQGHQAWFSGYGKRPDDGFQGHQAWFSGYGKRANDAFQGHQAWFSGYGKREGRDYQGHQAWFSGYGKRGEGEGALGELENNVGSNLPEEDGSEFI